MTFFYSKVDSSRKKKEMQKIKKPAASIKELEELIIFIEQN